MLNYLGVCHLLSSTLEKIIYTHILKMINLSESYIVHVHILHSFKMQNIRKNLDKL